MLEVTNERLIGSEDLESPTALQWAVKITGKEIISLLEIMSEGSASSREVARFEQISSLLVLATKPRVAEIIEAWLECKQIATASMLAGITGLPRQTCREKMMYLFRRKLVKKGRLDQLINAEGLDLDNNGLSAVVFYTDDSFVNVNQVVSHLLINCTKAQKFDSYSHVICIECLSVKNKTFKGQPCKPCQTRGFTTAFLEPYTYEMQLNKQGYRIEDF